MQFLSERRRALAIEHCRYDGSRLLFRGPKRSLKGRYIAFLGGNETFGKFSASPFPELVENMTGVACVNLGCPNAGLDVYLNDPGVGEIVSGAETTVIQIMGVQNVSNRFYMVHPRRNDRFLRASKILKTIYRDVDFTEFNFTRHLLTVLRDRSAEKFRMVEEELRDAWTARMRTLIERIEGDVVLLWLSARAPEEAADDLAPADEPLFVTRDMLEEVGGHATHLVEIRAQPAEIDAGQGGLSFEPAEAPAAKEMLGTVVHQRVADRLAPLIAGEGGPGTQG